MDEQDQRDKAEYAVLLVPEQVNRFIHPCSVTVHKADAIKSKQRLRNKLNWLNRTRGIKLNMLFFWFLNR